jgi:exodeoxyribonuclease V alpha subunit
LLWPKRWTTGIAVCLIRTSSPRPANCSRSRSNWSIPPWVLELQDGTVIADDLDGRRCVFLAVLYRAEREIAAKLKALVVGTPPPWPSIDSDKAIPWVEKRTKLALARSQIEAVRIALVSKVLVITGGPGVGKTTLVNSILKVLLAKNVTIALCAPTGRAAKRLSESTGFEAKTIHRLLETDPRTGRFRRDENELLDCDLLVVDETSMVDVPLMRALLRALPDRAALLLVGDVDQLPSVGPGQVLADIISSDAVPVVRLTEVFRQAAESRIITNAHHINQGQMPDLASAEMGDFYFVDAADTEDGVRKLLTNVQERIPKRFGLDPIRDIQVLCPMNRGGLGARSLNIELQKALNPPGEVRIERFGWTFCPGDKVMQIENDYDKDVYNGDLGFVSTIDMEESELVADFDGRNVRAGARLCDDDPQEPGLGIPGGGHPTDDATLPDAAAKPGLHWGDPRQAARRPRRAAEGAGDRRQGRADTAALVEAARVAFIPRGITQYLGALICLNLGLGPAGLGGR